MALADDSSGRSAGGEVDTDSDSTLLEVGLAVRCPGGETEHRHHRHLIENDNADIGNTFETIGLEKFEKLESFFKKSNVGSVGERKGSIKNVVDV